VVTAIGGLGMTRIFMVNDRFVSNKLPHYGRRGRLLRHWNTCVVCHFHCLLGYGSAMGIGQEASNRCCADQADQGQRNSSGG
jgi:hypothetical protein